MTAENSNDRGHVRFYTNSLGTRRLETLDGANVRIVTYFDKAGQYSKFGDASVALTHYFLIPLVRNTTDRNAGQWRQIHFQTLRGVTRMETTSTIVARTADSTNQYQVFARRTKYYGLR